MTGAGGFLGRRLRQALAGEGHREAGVEIDLAAADAAERLGGLGRRAGAPDVVIHLAARKPSPTTNADYARSNVLATANLLDALTVLGPVHVVATSTLSVYGEPDRNPVRESDPTHATHPYAVTKLAAEQMLLGASHVKSCTVIRLPSLYGVGQADSFVDGLAREALRGDTIELFGGGRVARDALHVSDALRLLRSAINSPGTGKRLLNAGCGRAIPTAEWAAALVAALGSASEIVTVDRPPTQPFDLYADNTQVSKTLGFVPMPLETAMRTFADELRAQP